MESSERAVRFLREIGREDLAGLINQARYRYGTEEIWTDTEISVVELSLPRICSEAVAGLPEWDQKRIAEAIHSTHQGAGPGGAAPDRLVLHPTDDAVKEPLFAEICIQRNTMVAVATGRGRIQELDDYYRARRRRISAALTDRGLDDPNPFEDLWAWYHKWKVDLDTYSARRRFIADLYGPLISKLSRSPEVPVPAREPTGWERVDRAVAKARQRLDSAKHEEDYQTVGLSCREVLISVGQAVFDPAVHISPDGVRPSPTDAGRMIESFFVQAAAAGSNESVRRHAKAALQLAVELQHRRTADFRAAALCLEATSSVTNIIAILSGQRDRDDETG